MSKAFTREPDGETEEPADDAPSRLPKGAKNYMTTGGFRRLRDELKHLTQVERPKVVDTVAWAASNGDRSENGDYIFGKKRLGEIDRRTRFLRKRLDIAVVVEASLQKELDTVRFGATVTYADSHDRERTIRIVGVDEARIDHGEVSWISPVARALMKAREGDTVTVQAPAGPEEIEVLEITYQEDGND